MIPVPDTILLVLVLWLIQITHDLLNRQKFTDWIELGICLGLCGLTKYTAIFLVISLVGIFFSEKAWSKINWGGFFVALVLALLLVSPVLIWNIQHGWISFSYQTSHVMGGQQFSPQKLGTFLITQILAYNPFLIACCVYGFWIGQKKYDQNTKMILWFAIPTLLFFTYTSFKDEVLPHWTLISWALLIPVGVARALQVKKNWQWSVVISAFLIVFVMTELTFPFLKFPAYQSPYADLLGWKDLHTQISQIFKKERRSVGIAVPNWTLGSRAHYYLEDLAPVFVLDDRFDQFDLWEKDQPKVKDLLVLSWKGFDLRSDERSRCQKIEPLKTEVFSLHGSPVNSVDLFWCRDFHWN